MSYYHETYQLGFGRLTPGVKWLLIINGAVFLIQQLFGPAFTFWFGLSGTVILNYFAVWQFVTYMFLHGGFFHIFFNMFVLWVFGCEVERYWGTRAFLTYYFITGIGAGIIGFFAYFATGAPMIGASGAIYGVILAFALMFPERVITLLLFFILPISMKAKYFALMLAGISLFSSVFGAADGVAHFAHLGGMLVGYLYLKSDWRKQSFLKKFKFKIKKKPVMKVYRSEKRDHRPEIGKDMDLQKQVDLILDKINEVGYEKLSRTEKEILRKASEDLSNKSKSP